MIDFNEFKIYEEFAYKFFDYANIRLNKYIFNCSFNVQHFGCDAYATTRYPNCITVFVGTFMEDYKGKNRVMSMIALSIAHELLHIEQQIDQYRYNTNVTYRDYIEGAVECCAFTFIVANANEIEKLFDFRIDIDPMYRITGELQNYSKFSAEDYYLHTLINTVVRDHGPMGTLKKFFTTFNNITVYFNNDFCVPIKYCGRFMEENLPIFSNYVFINCGAYDLYKVVIQNRIIDHDSIAINFTIYNRLMIPLR